MTYLHYLLTFCIGHNRSIIVLCGSTCLHGVIHFIDDVYWKVILGVLIRAVQGVTTTMLQVLHQSYKARTRPDILRVVLGPYVQYCPCEAWASEQKLGQKPTKKNELILEKIG